MEAISKLLPMQRQDLKEILKAMEGLPVTVRLLDPPLHEFLPSVEELSSELRTIRDVNSCLSSIANLPESMKYLDPSFGKPSSPSSRQRRPWPRSSKSNWTKN